jgi:hypothetical protein
MASTYHFPLVKLKEKRAASPLFNKLAAPSRGYVAICVELIQNEEKCLS